ncbi:MAG: CoA-binding protein [Chloroflexi bacterium]|nr:CoA-binding protein [Chloroflexota bacterium]
MIYQTKKEKPSLDEIFSPRGVAIVGASPSGGWATSVLQFLKEAEFPNIYPVNPNYQEVLGLPCYPSLGSIPGPVDHVIVSIRAESVLELLDECAAKGVKSVHFFTAGFSETGNTERAGLEKAMLDKAKAGGFRIIGPNSLGLMVPKSRLVNNIRIPLEPGPIAVISQSGGYVEDIPLFGSPRGLRFSKIVSYGNALDVNECELLEYFSIDPETRIIAIYIEGVRDGRRFVKALREATARKPVVICKGGTTEAGRRTTRSHTASLTSSVAVFNALCRQMKAIQVDDIEELTDMLVALQFVNPLPQGSGVAIIGAGGGISVQADDEMEKAGLHLPPFSPEAQSELKGFLPLAGSIFSNPLDADTIYSPKNIAAALRVVGRVPDVHMLIYHLGFHPVSRWRGGRFSAETYLKPVSDAIRELQQTTGKPVLLALRPPPDLESMKEFLTAQEAFVAAGLPVFHSMRRTARAIARLVAWRQTQNSLPLNQDH